MSKLQKLWIIICFQRRRLFTTSLTSSWTRFMSARRTWTLFCSLLSISSTPTLEESNSSSCRPQSIPVDFSTTSPLKFKAHVSAFIFRFVFAYWDASFRLYSGVCYSSPPQLARSSSGSWKSSLQRVGAVSRQSDRVLAERHAVPQLRPHSARAASRLRRDVHRHHQ